MKSVHLLIVLLAFSVTPMHSFAEIYKWKDKNGNVRYTDTPPPSNIKQETIGGKKAVKPTGNEPTAPAAPVVKDNLPTQTAPTQSAEDAAAEQRQRNAEAEKNNKQEQAAEAKRKAENCTAARANMETYTQGGRVYKMDENGERVYMDENDFKVGREKAEQEIAENCS